MHSAHYNYSPLQAAHPATHLDEHAVLQRLQLGDVVAAGQQANHIILLEKKMYVG